jgi:hypothetical protein
MGKDPFVMIVEVGVMMTLDPNIVKYLNRSKDKSHNKPTISTIINTKEFTKILNTRNSQNP